jgi:acetyl esterase/lipase
VLIAAALTAASVSFTVSSDSPAPLVSPVSAPAGQMTTLAYCSIGGIRLAMDLYQPSIQATRPTPTILYLYGGVWLAGGRGPDPYFQQLQQALNARGFAVASIDYRLGSLYAFPAQIEDPACAVRFLRAHAAQFGIDASRIGAWSASSGGTSAALLAISGTPVSWIAGQDQDQSSRVQAVVDVSGPTDFLQMGSAYSGLPGLVGNALVRESVFRNGDARTSASPVTYVGPRAREADSHWSGLLSGTLAPAAQLPVPTQ